MIAAALLAAATPLPAGYVDPAPVLAAARKAIGADRIRCITVRGTAYGGRLGQQRHVRPEGDWPIDRLDDYVRAMNWGARAMTEAFDRPPRLTPASFKYGAGWTGGTPLQKSPRVSFGVRDGVAWHRDGDGAAGRVPADIAAVWGLDLWLNPVGFLKAAAPPGAKPVAMWRWKIGEAGRDGPVVRPEKVHVVSIDLAGHKVDARINTRGLIQRLADGVFLMGGGTPNGVEIGMADHVVVVEAPLGEERSLAVIAAVAKPFPDKPIRYLVNTHQHFDHIGGLRTYPISARRS